MKSLILSTFICILLVSCNKKHSSDDGHNHSEEKTSAENHEGHDHGAEPHTDSENEEVKISKQALKNMGVIIEAVDSSTFTVYKPVPAVVKENPLNEQPVFAPFGGRIESIEASIGEFKEPGQTLIFLYRDPIKRPELKMVEDILSPASEEFHEAVTSLRQNLTATRILEQELARLQKFQTSTDTLALVPQKDLINLKYEIDKAEKAIENSRKKLELHGLSQKDIEQATKGVYKADLYKIWKNALKANNIWNENADTILSNLDEVNTMNRWVIASIGELVAEDLISKELIDWFKKDKKTGAHFLEIVSLLQSGRTISDLKALHDLGAFKEVIQISTPSNQSGWDVENIYVKNGQKVVAGEKLLTLTNQSNLFMFSYPQSSEVVDMNRAVKSREVITAKPLTAGSGPILKGLQIDKIRGKDDGREEVIISVENSILSKSQKGNKKFRSWSLRDGQQYILEVPIRKVDDVIVLPLTAVIQHGPDQVVFIKENDQFIRRKVVVVYQNNEVVVIGEGSELLPEENMVISGAFALQLALIAGTPEAVDPHAGHNH